MPLASCLVACLRDEQCDAVTVEWLEKRSWRNSDPGMFWYANNVSCSPRGGIRLPSCLNDTLGAHSTLTSTLTGRASGHGYNEG